MVVKLIETRYRVVICVAKLIIGFFIFSQKPLTLINCMLRFIRSIRAKTVNFEVEVKNNDAQQDVV